MRQNRTRVIVLRLAVWTLICASAACRASDVICASNAAAGISTARPLVGAIRFDAWKPSSDSGGQIPLLLNTPEYRSRWPYFVDPTIPSIDESPQAVMDRDILYAKNAGIDFWLFQPLCTWGRYGVDNYRASPYKSYLKFAKIEVSFNECRIMDTLNWLDDPQYLTCNGRPVIFMLMMYLKGFATPADVQSYRNRIIAAGHPNPYLIAMEEVPSVAANYADTWGFDAVSAYAGGTSGLPDGLHPYSDLVTREEQEWTERKDTGKQVVPVVTTGSDNRTAGGHLYVAEATPSEIANHLKNALDFVAKYPRSTEPNLVIMCAWNEYVEGSPLSPFNPATNAVGTGRLDAIAAVLH